MDINVSAFRVVQEAVGEKPTRTSRKVASSKGGMAGGRVRAKTLSSEQRIDIARKGSTARWNRLEAHTEQPLH